MLYITKKAGFSTRTGLWARAPFRPYSKSSTGRRESRGVNLQSQREEERQRAIHRGLSKQRKSPEKETQCTHAHAAGGNTAQNTAWRKEKSNAQAENGERAARRLHECQRARGLPAGAAPGHQGAAGTRPTRGSCGTRRAGGNRGHEGPECRGELGAGPGARMSSPVLPKHPQNPTAGTESARVTDGSGLERGRAQSIGPFGGV